MSGRGRPAAPDGLDPLRGLIRIGILLADPKTRQRTIDALREIARGALAIADDAEERASTLPPEAVGVARHVGALRKSLDSVVPALVRAIAAAPGDDMEWDLAKQAADINEGGDLRMRVVDVQRDIEERRRGA